MTLTDYALRFPQREQGAVEQDVECVEVNVDGEWQRIRFHDYEAIFTLPGLYEQLFSEVLECASPEEVVAELALHVNDPGALRVLDVGAGNGLVGEALRELGVATVVGVDILQAAADAAERDRPDVYEEYAVADLTQPVDLGTFDAMTTVAALGFGDMPPAAFAGAFNMVVDGGLVAMSIKDEFLEEGGFASFITRLVDDGAMEVLSRRRYRHRLSVTGEELHYVALVAAKRRSI